MGKNNKKAIKEIFVGGYGGSGTRIIQELLLQMGYYVGSGTPRDFYHGKVNVALDYLPLLKLINESFYKNNSNEIKELIINEVQQRNRWSIKHGQLMFMIPKIKELFPDSKFILMVRHGIDNILGYNHSDLYGKFIDPNVLNIDDDNEREMTFWNNVYDKAIKSGKEYYKDDFLIVRLEDLCNHTINSLTTILDFLEEEVYDINKISKIIKKPESIGRRFSDLSKEELFRLKKIGSKMLNYFNYD